MPDPAAPTLIEQVAYGFALGILRAWAEWGPQIVSSTLRAIREANQSTITEAPPIDAALPDAANKELTDALDKMDAARAAAGK